MSGAYSEAKYQENKISKVEFINKWNRRISSSEATYKAWADRFRVSMLYQYYEGFQWMFEVDENNRPYVINMIYSTIETKLPSLLFEEPQFSLRPRPIGTEFDENSANQLAQTREDALNFIANRPEFALSDKYELAMLDAFIGFGVIESDYSDDLIMNPYINLEAEDSPYACVYTKQIPFDTFRVSSLANWDLSNGKWYGYYEFIPWERLEEYHDKLKQVDKPYSDADNVSILDSATGKVTVATEANNVVGPAGTCKIWKIWDFERGKFLILAPDDAAQAEDAVLEYKNFDFTPLSFMRFTKRRKGWYPYPPVWNWISPQDELNDTRQAQRLHRKRFSRKYQVRENGVDDEELDKFQYGPDGTIVKVKIQDAITAIQDAPLDPVNPQSLMVTYDDFNRISGTSDERRGLQSPAGGNRTTATQANITNQAGQIRESKDSANGAEFLCSIARNILRALRKVKKDFWIASKLPSTGIMEELKPTAHKWTKVPISALRDKDYDVDIKVTSMSPIAQQQDKTAFMEFLALITQYEILAFSPDLLREAAYRVGYKNEAVLNQFQQLAQLASIGRLAQLKQQVGGAPQGPQPSQPGQLAQQQTDASTPPDGQQIMNMIFNKQGVQ